MKLALPPEQAVVLPGWLAILVELEILSVAEALVTTVPHALVTAQDHVVLLSPEATPVRVRFAVFAPLIVPPLLTGLPPLSH